MPDMSVIHTTAIYAPTADLPTFWDTVNETISKGDIENKLIIGDFNVTLNHNNDSEKKRPPSQIKARN